MRNDAKKIKYSILTINSDITVDQFTHRVINPTAALNITFDITASDFSTNAQFTIYASSDIPVSIKFKNSSGTTEVAYAQGYTVINTQADGTPVVGVTGEGNGSGFISSVIYSTLDQELTEDGKLVFVAQSGSELTAHADITSDDSFFYIVNTSGGNISFEGDTIPYPQKVGYVYSPADSGWVRFMTGGQGGTGFISEMIYKSANYTVNTNGMNIVVDTAGVAITPHNDLEVEPNFVYITNSSDGAISFAGVSVTNNSRAGFIYSDTTGEWEIFMKDSTTVATISHFVGFGSEIDVVDDNVTNYYMDLFPMTTGTVIDIDKYNLFFDDGSPAWRVLNNSVEVHPVATVGTTLTIT